MRIDCLCDSCKYGGHSPTGAYTCCGDEIDEAVFKCSYYQGLNRYGIHRLSSL